MTPEEIKAFGEAAKSLAKLYVELKAQLIREGVEPEEAITTARHIATAMVLNAKKDDGDQWKP